MRGVLEVMIRHEHVSVGSSRREMVTQNGQTNGWSSWSGGNYERNLVTEVDHGPNVLGWRRVILNHDNATTSLSASGESLDFSQDGSVNESWHTDPDWGDLTRAYQAQGCFVKSDYTLTAPDSLDYDSCVNASLMMFISKAIRAQRDLQGLVSIGELRETLHMIHRPLQTLRDSIFGYHGVLRKRTTKALANRSSFATRAKTVRAVIADTYLEYQFGWRATVNDVDKGLRALAHVVAYREPTKYVLGQSSSQRLGSFFAGGVNSGSGKVDTLLRTEHLTSVKIYGVVRARSGSDLDHVKSSFGLTWPDIIPSLWELIPYSFVVDYFTNIGAIIDAACFNTASVAWSAIGSYLSNSAEIGGQFNTPLASPNGHEFMDASIFVDNKTYRHARFVKSRAPYIGPYIPSLVFTLPGFRQNINLLALIGASRDTSRFLARKGG
jgi:hypothetical protein